MAQPPNLPRVVAGCWRMAGWGWTAAERLAWIEACLDRGITAFDHADLYGDYGVEALFAEALALAPGLRGRLQLVTKCGIRLVSSARPAHRTKHYDSSAAHIRASVQASLSALGTDRLDLLLLHRPDPLMDPDEVADAFARLAREGDVRAFGVSNFSPAQFELLDLACTRAGIALATNQIELHPLHRHPLHDGTLDQALRLGRRPMVWSPLAGGRLVEPAADPGSAPARVRQALDEIAGRLGVTPVTVALAWCLRHPARPSVVIGSRRREALDEAIAATGLTLSREDWSELWEAGAGHPLP
jgi:predicted oxidoreductase